MISTRACRRNRREALAAWFVPAAWLILAALGAMLPAAPARPEGSLADSPDTLVGEYRHSTLTLAGQARRSVATIARRGEGFAIAWQEDEGNLFGGIGLSLDGVFGAAYTEALSGEFRGSFVAAYRIAGGTLEGVRLPHGAPQPLVRERLQGAPGLQGRYDIVGGDGGSPGSVEITRQGDTYQMIWQAPDQTYEGVGLRIGDVLVAGFARGFAPALVAYCADAHVLTGLATYGHAGTVTPDRLVQAGTDGNTAAAEPSTRCRAAIDKWNPSLKRG
ncbi:MAG TPA: hypothetical protein PLR41_00305 [Alphaproteobacteria bacterium]|nr:hypothetical protein [Alphaproteobacteria bacterium]